MTKLISFAMLSANLAFAVSSSQVKMESYDVQGEKLEQLKIAIGGDAAKSFYDLLKKAHGASPDKVKKVSNGGDTYSIGRLYAFNTPPFEANVLLWLNLEKDEWFNGWTMTTQQGRVLNGGGYAPNSQSLVLYGQTARTVLEVMTLAGIEGKTAGAFTIREYKVGTTSIHCRSTQKSVSCGIDDSFKP